MFFLGRNVLVLAKPIEATSLTPFHHLESISRPSPVLIAVESSGIILKLTISLGNAILQVDYRKELKDSTQITRRLI